MVINQTDKNLQHRYILATKCIMYIYIYTYTKICILYTLYLPATRNAVTMEKTTNRDDFDNLHR